MLELSKIGILLTLFIVILMILTKHLFNFNFRFTEQSVTVGLFEVLLYGVLNIHQERMDTLDLNSMLKNLLTNERQIAFFGHI